MAVKTLYVGNIPYSATEESLLEHFAAYQPRNPRIIEGRGFAFVDVDGDSVEAAIEEKHNSEMGGRRLTVNEARPKTPGERGGGGGGGRSFGGGPSGGGGAPRPSGDRDGGGPRGGYGDNRSFEGNRDFGGGGGRDFGDRGGRGGRDRGGRGGRDRGGRGGSGGGSRW